jgi:membrane protein
MYLSSYVLLLGGELNSELEHQTAKDTTDGAHKPLGSRGAWAADHVAPMEEGSQKEQQQHASGIEREEHMPVERASPTREYLVARGTNRAGRAVGAPKVGMLSSTLATAGLAMMRKRGRTGAGAVLLATAAGLSLLQREE